MIRFFAIVVFVAMIFTAESSAAYSGQDSVTIIDSKHYSSVFGEIRNYRVFLPPGYFNNPLKRYPVIYFYHGWSQRFFGSGPDGYNHFERDDDNKGDNIDAFVSANEVIVVKADGYNRSREEEYYLRPYNIGPVETSRQFPLYFPELVNHIDASFKTIPDRNHRAISGLSMGGFMSYWIGGKYPDMICAIGNFCGSAEFAVGPKDFPVEYRNIDFYKNYNGVKVRLNFGNEDFIRYYHRDLNKVWLQVMDNYEYKIYEAAHSTCGMGEMFSFLKSTFENPLAKPENWNHIDVYPDFSVWDYKIETDREMPGFTVLENVNKSGFRCSIRQHLPDGETLPYVNVSVITPPVYKKNIAYTINDIDLITGKITTYSALSDNSGCLKIVFNGSTHEIGINSTDAAANIILESYSVEGMKYAQHGNDVRISVKLLNKGLKKGENLKGTLSAFRKSSVVTVAETVFGTVNVNEIVRSKSDFVFHTVSDTTVIERFKLTITDGNNNSWTEFFEVPAFRKDLPELKDFQVADGRKVVVASQGTGIDTLMLGTGNGDGIPNPGETIVILVKDGDQLRRCEILVSDGLLNSRGENKRFSDYWGTYDHVGGSAKYSAAVISSSVKGEKILSALVEYWMPDAPNHIIKQGIVNLKVTGIDKTPPSVDWVIVTGDNTIMLKMTDGSEIKHVTAKLSRKSDPNDKYTAELNNDGLDGDKVKGDFIFSYRMPIKGFGFYTMEITAADSFENRIDVKAPGIYVLH
jgi:poly(3-hydroxybutyrate) depolymerase